MGGRCDNTYRKMTRKQKNSGIRRRNLSDLESRYSRSLVYAACQSAGFFGYGNFIVTSPCPVGDEFGSAVLLDGC